MAERQQRIERGGLAGGDESWGKQAGGSAGVEVEEMCSDGDAEMLLAFEFESSVGEIGQGKVGGGLIRFGEPALVRIRGSFGHAEMIAPNEKA